MFRIHWLAKVVKSCCRGRFMPSSSKMLPWNTFSLGCDPVCGPLQGRIQAGEDVKKKLRFLREERLSPHEVKPWQASFFFAHLGKICTQNNSILYKRLQTLVLHIGMKWRCFILWSKTEQCFIVRLLWSTLCLARLRRVKHTKVWSGTLCHEAHLRCMKRSLTASFFLPWNQGKKMVGVRRAPSLIL